MLLLCSRERWRNIVMSMSVCLSVCLSVREHISRTTRAIFTKFLCMFPMTLTRSFSGRVTKSQGKGAILGVFLSTDPLTMHCNAFAAKGIIQYRTGMG